LKICAAQFAVIILERHIGQRNIAVNLINHTAIKNKGNPSSKLSQFSSVKKSVEDTKKLLTKNKTTLLNQLCKSYSCCGAYLMQDARLG
jgi:hypothetical protein